MSLLIQLVQLWKSPNSGILGVFVGNFQFGSNLTQKMPLYYSIFRYFCSKNRTSRNFHHFIDIPYLISQKIDHNCFLSHIADKFPYCSETPIFPCPPLLSHLCPLFSTFNYLKMRFFTRDVITFPVILVTKA